MFVSRIAPVFAVLTLAAAVPAGAAEARFPVASGKNLEGRKFNLPSDFEAERNLVFVAFQRRQQDDIDLWMKNLGWIKKEPRLKVYEVPVLSRMNGISRSFIDRGMAAGIPSKEARESTITLYLDKEPFRKSLGIDTEDNIHILLVDRQGRVLWRAEGVFTKAKLDSLKKKVLEKPAEPKKP